MPRFAAVGLLLLTAVTLESCDAPAPTAKPAPSVTSTPGIACSGERITVGRVSRHDVLTHLTGPDDPAMVEVRSYAPGVKPGDDVPADRIYQAFDDVVDDVDLVGMRPLGTTFVPTGTWVQATPSDRIVHYDGVQAVEAAFTYECGGSTRRGVVSSWTRTITGVLDCTLPDQFRGDRAAVDAAVLACPTPE